MQGTNTRQGGHASGDSRTVIAAKCVRNIFSCCESHECRVWLGVGRSPGTLLNAGLFLLTARPNRVRCYSLADVDEILRRRCIRVFRRRYRLKD